MSYSKDEGLTLPGEDADKCCFFLPLKTGVMVIGLIMISWGFNAAMLALRSFNAMSAGIIYLIFGIGYVAAAAPVVLGAFYFFNWFKAMDDKDTRNNLNKACMLVILSSIIVAGVAVAQFLLTSAFTIGMLMSPLVSAGTTAVVYFYYAGVCTRYAKELA